jgi:SulP family sulfate permease
MSDWLHAVRFRPRLFDSLRGYTRRDLRADVGAGATVGVIALPLSMAFAIASGLPPQAGLVTAIVAGFLISALGGSRVQIGGPSAVYIVIAYGVVVHYGAAGLVVCTIGAGVLLLAMGLARLGALIRFIPVSIVIGFTNGIAVLIVLSQLSDLLGLDAPVPEEFFRRVHALAANIGHVDPVTLAVSVACIAVLLLWPRAVATEGHALAEDGAREPATMEEQREAPARDGALVGTVRRGRVVMTRVPGLVVVLIGASLAVALLQLPVETIGTRFGAIAQEMPALAWPDVSLSTLRNLIAPTITIALLGAIESLLSARVADAMTDDQHDPNQELMGQGIANIVAPFFGGLPATGAIARTATNVRSGGRTPVAGMVHALTLLVIVLVAAPLAQYVPVAALSAILVVVAVNMGNWSAFRELRKYSIPYRAVLLSTFVVTVVFDLTLAVEIGLVLASLFFIYRVSDLTRVETVRLDGVPPSIAAFKVFGSLFFGSVGKLEPLFDHARAPGQIVILEMHQVISIDNTGLETLQSLQRALARRGGRLILCGLNRHPAEQVARAGFIGPADVLPHLAAALFRVHKLLDESVQADPPAPGGTASGIE